MSTPILSIPARFWALVAVILCVAIVSTSAAVHFTTSSYLREVQDGVVADQAQRDARALETLLEDHRQFLSYLAAEPGLVSVVVGNVYNTDAIQRFLGAIDPPEGARRMAVFDALHEVVTQRSFGTDRGWHFDDARIQSLLRRSMSGPSGATVYDYEGENGGGHFLVAVPVRNRGFAEGVLLTEFAWDVIALAPDHQFSATTRIFRTFVNPATGQLVAGASEGEVLVPMGSTGLWMAMKPDRAEIARVDREVVTTVAGAVAIVLLLPFALLALLGRRALVAPHMALQASEEELRQQAEKLSELAAVAEKAEDAIIVTDLDAHIVWVNPSFEQISGRKSEEVVGQVPGDFLQGTKTDPKKAKAIRAALDARQPIRTELLNYHASGVPYWIALSIAPLFDAAGKAYGFMAISRDISEDRRRTEALVEAKREIEHQALHDALTDLPNRRALDHEIAIQQASGQADITLVRIDLDHFKYVNDTMGHAAGDFVLCAVARILTEETGDDTVAARVGGDEFVLLLPPEAGIEDGEVLARRLLARIREPMQHDGRHVQIGASFGVASTQGGLLSDDDIIVGADAALYLAKDDGRNTVRLYTPQVHRDVKSKRHMATEIRQGIRDRSFVPFYQPQVCARTHRVSGVETLVRWPDAAGRFRAPGEFLPVAEQLSVVADIDAIVFRRALSEMRDLNERGLVIPKVSFNVTAARLQDTSILETIRTQAPRDITVGFEILESVLVEEQSTSFSYHLDRLREVGVSIEIDDFGSGHASIIGLTHAAPDVMKIDQRLIFPLTKSETSRQMVKSIIEIGQALDIKVTAEGVETLQHAHILSELGCDTLQGYYFAKPMGISDLERFLEARVIRANGGTGVSKSA